MENRKELNGKVDRTHENSLDDDATIDVTLENGYHVAFWDLTLTDEEYLKRTNFFNQNGL